MDITLKDSLKIQFKEAFPEYAMRMERATNQQEAESVYNEIVSECYKKLKEENNDGRLKDGNEGIIVYIKQKDYERLLNAKGSDIEYQISKILNSFSSAKAAMDSGDAETATASILTGGVLAIGASAIGMCYVGLKAGATTYAAALSALTNCWSGVFALISFIVTLILIPILYFMEKPATTIMLLLNETDETIQMADNHIAHGKQLTLAKEIDPKEEGMPGCVAGAFICSKKDMALIGTNTGYHFKLEESKKDFYIGVECPLTSMYGDNNCACSNEGSAEKIAQVTNSKNIQKDSCTNGDFKCSVSCNDKGGSIAYYIARIYK